MILYREKNISQFVISCPLSFCTFLWIFVIKILHTGDTDGGAQEEMPAYKQTCNTCKKQDHFKVVYRSTGGINITEEGSNDGDESGLWASLVLSLYGYSSVPGLTLGNIFSVL